MRQRAMQGEAVGNGTEVGRTGRERGREAAGQNAKGAKTGGTRRGGRRGGGQERRNRLDADGADGYLSCILTFSHCMYMFIL